MDFYWLGLKKNFEDEDWWCDWDEGSKPEGPPYWALVLGFKFLELIEKWRRASSSCKYLCGSERKWVLDSISM